MQAVKPSQEIAERILKFLLPQITKHQTHRETTGSRKPFIFGLTGLQGSGKSTLAAALVDTLSTTHCLRTITISLDDFYQTWNDRNALRVSQPSNDLLRVRGQPGTHDVELAEWFFSQFTTETVPKQIGIPIFDKSLFDGDGDRLPRSLWKHVEAEPPVDLVVFEGWCLGFQPLSKDALQRRWSDAMESRTLENAKMLSNHSWEDLFLVNENLAIYCAHFMGPQHLDCIVSLDALELFNVYVWRQQQEDMLRRTKGTAMTDEQVIKFVDGYMPAYELYLDGLREGFFPKGSQKLQLHVLLNEQRTVTKMEVL
ncbi:D-glycerate 3-kinase-like protein [Hyaloscypha variabilis]